MAAVVALLLGGALTGCDARPVDPDARALSPLETVTVEPVTPVASLQPSSATSQGWSLAPPTAELPGLATAVRTEPGQPSDVALWTWLGAKGLERVDVELGLTGAASWVDLVATSEQVVLVGNLWTGSSSTPFVRTSTDRSTWATLDLSAGLAGMWWAAAGAVGDAAVLIGQDREGHVAGMVVAGDEVRRISLPDVADGQDRQIIGVAGHDEEIVVLVRQGVAGGIQPLGVHISHDGGATFGRLGSLYADEQARAAGIVWTGSQYLVTGSTRWTHDSDARRRAAVWTSPDAVAWADADSPFSQEWEDTTAETADTSFGEPTVNADGQAAFVATNSMLDTSSYVTWGSQGVHVLPQETPNGETGVGGVAVQAPDGSVYAVLEQDGQATFQRASPDGWAREVGQMTRRSEAARLRHAAELPGAVRLGTEQVRFDADDGWQRSIVSGVLGFDGGDALVEGTWDLPSEQLPGDARLAFDADPTTGAAVAVGTGWQGEEIVARGLARSTGDAPWEPSGGFGEGPDTQVYLVRHAGLLWAAAGFVREPDPAAQSRLTLWTSPDGIAWERPAIDLAAQGESSVADICALPDGRPLAVGSVKGATGARAAVWLPVDGAWQQVTPAGAEPGSSVSACAPHGDGVVLVGTHGGVAAVWHTVDGVAFEASSPFADGDGVAELVAVGGGLVAAGRADDDEHTGAAIWLSADGATWARKPVPARADAWIDFLATSGDDVLLAAPTQGGQQVWVVRDLPSAWDALSGLSAGG